MRAENITSRSLSCPLAANIASRTRRVSQKAVGQGSCHFRHRTALLPSSSLMKAEAARLKVVQVGYGSKADSSQDGAAGQLWAISRNGPELFDHLVGADKKRGRNG